MQATLPTLVVNNLKLSHVCAFCLYGLKDCNCSFYLTVFVRAEETLTSVSHFVVQRADFIVADSVCSLRPAPFSYLCVRVRILGVLKLSAAVE